MDEEKIKKIIRMLEQADIAADSMESRGFLLEAQAISKTMSQEDFKEGVKRSIIALLNKGSAGFTMEILFKLQLFPELISDLEVYAVAKQAYDKASQNQLEIASEIKESFKLS